MFSHLRLHQYHGGYCTGIWNTEEYMETSRGIPEMEEHTTLYHKLFLFMIQQTHSGYHLVRKEHYGLTEHSLGKEYKEHQEY